MEIFKDIQGYEGLYQVSNLGNVKSLKFGKEKILKPGNNGNNYLFVILSKQGKLKSFYVHKLVAYAFIDNPNNLTEINHIDEDKTNNAMSNLNWCDRIHNCNFGTRNQKIGENNTNHPNKSKRVLCLETGIIYPSIIEVQRQLGFNRSSISQCCNGRYKTSYGLHWRYVS